MSRSLPLWIGATDDTPAPPRVRVRVFERCDGKCTQCGRKLRPGEAWTLEHLIALINGGRNAEDNLGVTCGWCLPGKNAVDVALKAKTYAVKSKHILPKERKAWQSRQFPSAPPQRTATTPPTKVFRRTYALAQEDEIDV